MKLTIKGDIITAHHEPGDPRMKRGGYGAGAESMLLHHVKRAMQDMGFDVIKRKLASDGHMVSDHVHGVFERDRHFVLWNGDYQIFDAGERFNEDGHVSLNLDFLKETTTDGWYDVLGQPDAVQS